MSEGVGEASVCRRCGLLSSGQKCPGCESEQAKAEPLAQALPDGVGCAVVWASMACRVCGLSMPINHLPIGGSVRCLHCGLAQAADEGSFDQLVDTAHAVVDLAGEEGPYQHVGPGEPLVREELGEGWVSVGVGQPRCRLCNGALRVTPSGQAGCASTICLACGAEGQYRAELSRDWSSVVAVIAPEHQSDRLPAKTSSAGAVLALSCPKCGGPLHPEPGQDLVRCSYCDTTSVIVEETRALMKAPPKQEPWYLLVRGPSPLRLELAREAERRARQQEAEQNRRRKGERRALDRQRGGAPVPRPSWVERNFSSIAGFSGPVSGFACCALVAIGAHRMGYEDSAIPIGFGVYFVVTLSGIALQGKGKIADMPRATAWRVLNLSIVWFLVCVGALLVMLALSGS